MNAGDHRANLIEGWRTISNRPGPTHVMALVTFVLVAVALGADWLTHPLLGLPVGLWVIALGFVLMRAVAARTHEAKVRRTTIEFDNKPLASTAQPVQTAQAASPVGAMPSDVAPSGRADRHAHRTRRSKTTAYTTLAPAIDSVAAVARRFGPTILRDPDRFSDVRETIIDKLDRSRWPAAPVRIGLDLPWAFAQAILSAPGVANVRFEPVDASFDDETMLRRAGFDAIIRQTNAGPTRIVTPEHDGLEAGWFDWARPTPLSYASVFPSRIDPNLITFAGLSSVDDRQARTIRLLAEAAALLSRTPARLGLTDRIRGRRPIDFRLNRWDGESIAPHAAALHAVLEQLGEIVVHAEKGDRSPALAAAARATSAWFVTADWFACEETRRRVIESAVRVLPDEPEPALRAVAVEFADLDDDAAMETVVRAEAVMREHAHLTVADTGAFVQSEIDCGVAGPLTVGRVAAGICMMCALTEPAKLQFYRQDLTEDLRFAPWLLGRDADARVLIEVVRTIERARGQKPSFTLTTAA
jgi:hypothetical protein